MPHITIYCVIHHSLMCPTRIKQSAFDGPSCGLPLTFVTLLATGLFLCRRHLAPDIGGFPDWRQTMILVGKQSFAYNFFLLCPYDVDNRYGDNQIRPLLPKLPRAVVGVATYSWYLVPVSTVRCPCPKHQQNSLFDEGGQIVKILLLWKFTFNAARIKNSVNNFPNWALTLNFPSSVGTILILKMFVLVVVRSRDQF